MEADIQVVLFSPATTVQQSLHQPYNNSTTILTPALQQQYNNPYTSPISSVQLFDSFMTHQEKTVSFDAVKTRSHC